MQDVKAAVRRFFYKRQIDTLLLALYLYLLAAILMAVSSIDLTGLLGNALLPDQSRFRFLWIRNPALDYAPSLFVGLLALYPLALLATLASFNRMFTWTNPTETRSAYFGLSLGAFALGVLIPLLLLTTFDTDSMSRRARGLMTLVVQNDLTLALTFGLMFWASAFFLAGAHFFFKLGRDA